LGKNTEQLLVRPVEIYEFPHSDLHKLNVQSRLNKDSNIELETKAIYLINLIKLLKVLKNLNLVTSVLTFKPNKFLKKNTNIELFANKRRLKQLIYVSVKSLLK
jgi:hypothetical protein